MSQLEMAPNTGGAWWSQNILGACALAQQAPLERRLAVFLAALATETVRLIGTESDEGGEALIYAAIGLRVLFTGPDVIASEEELDQWSSRVQVMLIMESLQRRGFVHVAYEDPVTDPLGCDALPQVIGRWPASLQNGDPGNGSTE